jgi:hypothetical protein
LVWEPAKVRLVLVLVRGGRVDLDLLDLDKI